MLFNSYAFWIFLALVWAIYRLLPHRGQNLLLLAASYFFYGCWDWRFLPLILTTTLVNYYTALGMESSTDPKRHKLLMAASATVSLGLLAYFKYMGFFAESAAEALTWLGVTPSWSTLNIVLPVGISFYTFQTMSYTIDVYRGQIKATHRFTDFALYVAYFPQLVAGPIERSSSLMPQVTHPRRKRKIGRAHV